MTGNLGSIRADALACGIRDMAILERPDLRGRRWTILYYVASFPVREQPLAALAARLGLAREGMKFVRVSTIPLRDAGEIDEVALGRVPVIDGSSGRFPLPPGGEAADSAVFDIEEDWFAPVQPPAAPAAAGEAVDEEAQLALAVGPATPRLAGDPATLADLLESAARHAGGRGCTFIADETVVELPYDGLLARAGRVRTSLRRLGLVPGEIVIVLAADHAAFLSAFWGSILAGAVAAPAAVPMRFEADDAAAQKLLNSLPLFNRPWLIGGEAEAALLAPLLAGQDVRLLSIADLLGQDEDEAEPPFAADPQAPALIMLTSGSTGRPKAVVQSHAALLRQLASAAHRLSLTPADVSLNWFGFDHVGGIVMFHLRDMAMGCAQVHAPTMAITSAPLRWLDLIDRFRVTISWAPNFAFGLVNAAVAQQGPGRWDLACVRVLMNAGEAISSATACTFLQRLARYGLSATAMWPAWGMSETCSAVTYAVFDPATDGKSGAVCVGAPVDGIAMRIVDADDHLLREGEVGRLQVCGQVVTSGYLRNPEANAAAFTADGWFRTGDLGFLRDGALTVTGRENDVIIVNGRNIYVSELEERVAGVAGVDPSFVAAVPLKDADSEAVGLFFSSSSAETPTADFVRGIRAALLGSHGVNPAVIVRLPHEAIPKTTIGKIQRSLLVSRLQAGELDAYLTASGQILRDSPGTEIGMFEESWVPCAARESSSAEPTGPILLFAPDAPSAAAMRSATGMPCVAVVPGERSGWLDAHLYSLNGAEDGSYARLLDELSARGLAPATVLHAWLTGSPCHRVSARAAVAETLEQGFFSIFRLLGAFARSAPGALQLVAATRGAVPLAGETGADAAAALVSAFVDAAQAELPGLVFRHVDLPRQADARRSMELLLRESGAADFEAEIVLRDERRLIRGLQRVAGRAGTDIFRRGDLVLVTGGRGGLGTHLVEHLMAVHGVEVLIFGRKEATARDRTAWTTPTASQPLYARCDLGDAAAIRAHVADAERLLGARLRTVVHLAGSYEPAGIAAGDEAAVRRMFLSKIDGTLALEEALVDRPDVRTIHTSSVTTMLRGRDSVGYAAANRFVEIAAQAANRARPARCIAWGIWDETGVGRDIGAKELMRRQGFQLLRPSRAVAAFEAALGRDQPLLFVGLDPGRAEVLRRVKGHCVADRRLLLRDGAGFGDARPCDAFGTPIPWASERPTGADAPAARMAVLPATETERALADIWRRILDDPGLGVTDNFFEIGGTSLNGAMLLAAVERRFGVQLPFSTILTHPTIRQFATRIDPQASGTATTPAGAGHLVPLRTRGTQPPLFGVHPLFGLVYPYVELAQRLRDQPFYALQAKGFAPGSQPYRTIREMAAAYIEAIRTIQPAGPYRVGGWSLGSLIALEMAVQLEAAGHPVESLVIIDQATDSVQRFLDSTPISIQARRLMQILGAALGNDDPAFRAAPSWTYPFRRPGRFIRFVRRTMVPMLRIALVNRKAARDYVLPRFEGNILLFHTGDPEFTRIQDPRLGWNEITSGDVHVSRIPGAHLTLHEMPYVEILAEKLEEALNRHRAAATPRVAAE